MTWQRGTLADFCDDWVLYRNLDPMHPGLPRLAEVWQQVGLPQYYIPRKTTPEYAAVVVHFLQLAQQLRGIGAPLEKALFVGDTLMNDGGAARNIGHHLAMRGLIAAEKPQQAPNTEAQGDLLIANRWEALAEFDAWAGHEGIVADERTALLLDLDKTTIGARGRNDKPIDAARTEAMKRILRAALGGELDEDAFRCVYDTLNQPRYHPFTADNQDYLAYICLMVVSGVYPAKKLWADLESQSLSEITAFMAHCDDCRRAMSPALLAAHEEVRRGLEANDPTPYKEFRRKEYLETVGRMDYLPDDAPVAEVLAQEITLTAEVASYATHLAEQGVLVVGLSDKPDEASLPTAELAAQGYQPLHRTPMKIYGARLF